eukprot:754775-Hanusia_phi.AAC.1
MGTGTKFLVHQFLRAILIFSNLAATIGAGNFVVKTISQTNPLTDASNQINLTFSLDLNISNGAAFEVSGLTNAIISSTVELLGHDASLFWDGTSSANAIWQQGSWTMKFFSMEALTANTPYSFYFTIENPSNAQINPAIYISCNDSEVIGPTLLDTPNISLFGIDNGANALLIVQPEFTKKLISQNTTVPNSANLISISIIFSSDITPNSFLTITGLTGTQSFGQIFLQSTNNVFQENPQWYQENGTLIAQSVQAISVSEEISLSFVLQNPSTDSDSPSITIGMTIESGLHDSRIPFSHMYKPSQSLFGIANGTDPLTVRKPLFITRYAEQSNPIALGLNRISFDVSTNYELSIGSTFTISGLIGSSTQTSESLAVQMISPLISTNASWVQGSGTLLLTFGGTVASQAALNFEIVIENSWIEQSPQNLFIEGDILTTGLLFIGQLDQTQMEVSSQTILGVVDGGSPMRIVIPILLESKIQQSNPLTDASNQIDIQFKSNIELLAGTTVAISGIDQYVVPSSLAVVMTEQNIQGTYSNGVLKLSLPFDINANTSVSFYFDVKNPPEPFMGSSVNISITSPNCSIQLTELASDAIDAFGIVSGRKILYVVQPLVTFTLSGQSTPYASAINTIYVNFALNCELTAGSVIRIEGLTGSTTTDNPNLPITFEQSGSVVGEWLKSGILIVNATNSVSNHSLEIKFNLTNPTFEQTSPFISIKIQIESGDYDSSTIATTVQTEKNLLLGVQNGTETLTTIRPSFTNTLIIQDSPYANTQNNLNIFLKANCDIRKGSKITLRGLTGSQTED